MTDSAGPQWTALQPPADITGSLFNRGRQIARTHPLACDTLLAVVLLALSTVWLTGAGFATPKAAVLQTALVATVAVRRVWPLGVFLLACVLAFVQWLLGFPLIGDGALLICLYTVASWPR